MDEENKAIKDRDRALQAKQLIEHPLFKEAFEKLEAEMMVRWRSTGTAESHTLVRERLWQAVNILGKVREAFEQAIENGKMAEAILRDIEGKRQRAA